MNLLTFIVCRPDNSLLMRPWFLPIVALCVVALTAALVAALVALARVGRRTERVLALVERELEHDVPPLMADLRELSGLHRIEDRHTTHLIGVSTLLQGGIVQLFATAQRPFQRPDLFLGRIETKLIRLTSQVRILR